MGRSHDLATGVSYQDQTETDARYHTKTASDAAFAAKAGDTFTGPVTVATSTSANLTVNSGVYGGIQLQSGGTNTGYITSYTNGSGTEAMYIGGADTVNLHTGTNHALTGGTTRLQINASGHVTMPYQPAFDVAQPAQVSGDHTFSQIHLNRGSHYDNSNGRFTAPVAGVYVFNFGGIKNGNSTTTVRLYVKKNGSRLHSQRHLRLDGGQVNTYGDNGSVQWIAELAVNDYIQAETGAGGIYNATGEYTTFSGFLVG